MDFGKSDAGTAHNTRDSGGNKSFTLLFLYEMMQVVTHCSHVIKSQSGRRNCQTAPNAHKNTRKASAPQFTLTALLGSFGRLNGNNHFFTLPSRLENALSHSLQSSFHLIAPGVRARSPCSCNSITLNSANSQFILNGSSCTIQSKISHTSYCLEKFEAMLSAAKCDVKPFRKVAVACLRIAAYTEEWFMFESMLLFCVQYCHNANSAALPPFCMLCRCEKDLSV
jgi:hypothetical protein